MVYSILSKGDVQQIFTVKVNCYGVYENAAVLVCFCELGAGGDVMNRLILANLGNVNFTKEEAFSIAWYSIVFALCI